MLESRYLLSPVQSLPDSFVTIALETTGLIVDDVMPDVLALGTATVVEGDVVDRWTAYCRPDHPIEPDASRVNGITDAQASQFPPISSGWSEFLNYVNDECLVIHNAAFVWSVLLNAVNEHDLSPPQPNALHCSQKALNTYGQLVMGASQFGPALNHVSAHFESQAFKSQDDERHDAGRDAEQLAQAIIRIKSSLKDV